jgi:hypothetical protein
MAGAGAGAVRVAAVPPPPAVLTEEDLLKAMVLQQHQMIRQADQLNAIQSDTRSITFKQDRLRLGILMFIGVLILIAVWWYARNIIRVRAKYSEMYRFLSVMHNGDDPTGATYDLSPLFTCWCAEYPNYTELLRSRFPNPNMPKAISLSFYSVDFQAAFQQDPATSIQNIYDVSQKYNDISAAEIVCMAYGKGELVEECLPQCDPPYAYTSMDMATDVVAGGLQAGLLATSALFCFPGLGAAIAIPVVVASVGVGLGLGGANASAQKNSTCAACYTSQTACAQPYSCPEC